jgi:hypothetical protein
MRSLLRKTFSPAPLPQREGRYLLCTLRASVIAFLFAMQVLASISAFAVAQVEAFRARIVLLPGGTVSISVDGGTRFTTIGRITALPQRLSSSKLPPRTAAFQGKGLWLLQHNETQSVGLAAANVQLPTALRTDIPAESLLFRDCGQGVSARLMLQEGLIAYSLPPGYRYRVGDVWVLQVLAQDEAQAQTIRETVAAALPGESREAIKRSIQRGEKANLPVVNGTLNLEVTARHSETVQFVFFTVDGYPVGTSNVLPTLFRWDSTQVADGEYVLEARAVDKDGREVALVRKRILVKNGEST